MFRLRTTTSLSLLALAVGTGGTAWLSGQTAGWAGPAVTHAQAWPVYRAPHRHARSYAPWHVVQASRRRVEADPGEAQAGTPPPTELVPVAMPSRPVPYEAMRHHLRGRVLLQLHVDGQGRVVDAEVASSSGDDVLDAHALATVRDWRFAVPEGHPDGISGELPMRFTAGDGAQLAQAP